MDSGNALTPLASVTKADLQRLCQTLWLWDWCDVCTSDHSCGSMSCPWRRWKLLNPFFQVYRSCTSAYAPQDSNHAALRGHEDLLKIIRLLQHQRNNSRETLMGQFLLSQGGSRPEESDLHRAFNLAFEVMTTVTCSGESQAPDLFGSGSKPVEWRNADSVVQLLESAFPIRDHPALNENDATGIDVKSQLTAVQLRKIAGLKFRGTDYLKDHLRIIQEEGVVEFYHHTSFLNENLRMRVLDPNTSASEGETQSQCSVIPRQLALETLDSLQRVIFPRDRESRRLLISLVSKQDLDPNCLNIDSAIDRSDDENDIKYLYWGSRLMDLFDEIGNPRPRGFLEQWMERKSGARYVMMATLTGVMIAVILGLLGLGVSVFQAWVGYQQWKHPVVDG